MVHLSVATTTSHTKSTVDGVVKWTEPFHCGAPEPSHPVVQKKRSATLCNTNLGTLDVKSQPSSSQADKHVCSNA